MEDKEPIYTDFEIIIKKDVNLKKYFNSIFRNLPSGWKLLKDEHYKDQDTFKIINETRCMLTPFYRNVSKEYTFRGKVFIGLTDSSIILLKIDFDNSIEKLDSVQLTGYIIDHIHEEILKKNKYYGDFNHNFVFGGPSDENWYRTDIRDQRQIRVYSKSDKKTYSLMKGAQAEFKGIEIFYNEPNNISIALSIMRKSYKKALDIYKTLQPKNVSGKFELSDELRPLLYDYFEEIITSITFAYIAVEALSNAAIPDNYKHRIVNEKGVKEIWPKESIERWMSTTEKVSEILPKILKSKNIKEQPFWCKFKELETIRNEIVHQKTIEKGTKLDSQIFTKLLNPEVFYKIKSSLSVLQFFYDLDNSHPYFPLGLGIAKFQINEIESMEKHFKAM